MEKLVQKASKSALSQEELQKIVSGKRIDADTVAVAYEKALYSEKSHYDLSNITDPAERQQAIDRARGDNAAIYLKMSEAFDAKMALVRARDEPVEEVAPDTE